VQVLHGFMDGRQCIAAILLAHSLDSAVPA
jgi:hypothetical protein